jgi:hypothetical protein
MTVTPTASVRCSRSEPAEALRAAEAEDGVS